MIEGTITKGWPVGARFWYQSKYSDTLVEGVVASYRNGSYKDGEEHITIESTNGRGLIQRAILCRIVPMNSNFHRF